jgi:hypothetical protein
VTLVDPEEEDEKATSEHMKTLERCIADMEYNNKGMRVGRKKG